MKSKIVRSFYVTYIDDNTKSCLMIFDDSLTNLQMVSRIMTYFRDDYEIANAYSDEELLEAATDIVNDVSWTDGVGEYFIETQTLYYN